MREGGGREGEGEKRVERKGEFRFGADHRQS